jgi:hypothetical protein
LISKEEPKSILTSFKTSLIQLEYMVLIVLHEFHPWGMFYG